MLTDKLKTLAATRAKVAELEKKIATELNRELAALPKNYGFDNLPAFFDAVRAAVRGKGRVAGKSAADKTAAPSGGRKRRKRAVITAQTKAKVKSLVDAGKTGGEIASAVGISLPSVQNIKKELGLVKPRK